MELKELVCSVLDKDDILIKGEYEYVYKFYANRDDKLDYKTALDICESYYPYEQFYSLMGDWYEYCEYDAISHYFELVSKKVFEAGIDASDDEIRDLLYELIVFEYPEEHYLNQEFNVNIILDTGDGNYDFIKNNLDKNGDIHPSSFLLWLANQQGYSKEQLVEALSEENVSTISDTFLRSCAKEVCDNLSSVGVVTFLTKMTLKDLMDLNTALNDKNKKGTLELSDETVTGLFDLLNGAGGPFDIALAKNVEIPIKYIFSVLPDNKVKEVYNWCDDVYSYNVKEIKLFD